MEDQLISDETGILAKEKGFNEPSVLVRYIPNKIKKGYEIRGEYTKRTYDFYKNPSKDRIERIHLVTQSLLQKWLRNKHMIFVGVQQYLNVDVKIDDEPFLYNGKYIYYIERVAKENSTIKENEIVDVDFYKKHFNTYEEALECGLYEALKLI